MWKETQLLSEERIRNMLPLFIGERNQKYPPFSSVRVKGKPLFHWAKMGKEKLEEMSPFVPSVRVTVMDLKLLDCYWLDLETLQRIVRERIGSVKSSSSSSSEETFRQTEILQSWNDQIFTPLEHLLPEEEEEYEKERGEHNTAESRRTKHWSWPVFRMKATVTSGTYIRSLADEMGRALSFPEEEGEERSGGVGAIAFDIYRTRVGQHNIDDALSPPFFDAPSK
ncbi:pseudouridine synthase pus4 [Balamuthia mandrillaris]